MKYLGILKDSFREAIDSKVFYVTLAISCCFILFIGSVTFRPVTVEEQFKQATKLITFFINLNPQYQGVRYDIADFEQTNEASEPWLGDYRFTYYVEAPATITPDQAKQVKAMLSPGVLRDQIKQSFPWTEEVVIGDAPRQESPTELRYQVELRGTKVQDRRGWPHEPALLFGAVPLPLFQSPLAGHVVFIAGFLIGTFGAAVTMLLSTVITASFIPQMLRKGTVDLLLAKPIQRSTLLLYKYVGGMTFMFLNTVVIVVGIWLVLGMQTHIWINGFLLCILIFTLQFAIFYAVSTLMAVLTHSPVISILAAVVTWAALFLVGWLYPTIDRMRPEKSPQNEVMTSLPKGVFIASEVIHFIAPHYKEFDTLTSQLISRDLHPADSAERRHIDERVRAINWYETVGMTLAFIVLVLGLACQRFTAHDY